ncbi:DMT family transporter [Halioxenophilus aromaticivorans]|uniref:DMT family transporter n=1 Tax=Halioxenophilus aromaticivorans TaxID=1306992 RepID=A0AAV3U996_9ALTE
MKIVLLTSLSLIAFAGNSILCRLALGGEAIDAGTFTIVRLISGIAVLLLIHRLLTTDNQPKSSGSWKSAVMLFVYALGFSYAYVQMDTGTGALILFAAVQLTMITVSLLQGNRLTRLEALGAIIAFIGFVYLMLPGVTAPPMGSFFMMLAAGIAWGLYTLAGKGSTNPIQDTTFNFVRTLPLVLVLLLVTFSYSQLSTKGFILAVVSGGLASGVGYAVWYVALTGLSAIQAAVLQLLVPLLAALGGVLFADEIITSRLAVATGLILGGIGVVIGGRAKHG